MKKFLMLFIPVLVVAGTAFVFKNGGSGENVLGTFSGKNIFENKINSINQIDTKSGFRVYWFESNPSKLKLIPNFENPLTASEARVEYGCHALINGGFYTIENKPLGLFVNDEGKLESWHESSLLNGILTLNYLDTPRITRAEPKDSIRIGVQTGPFLKENGSYLDIKSSNDEARRSVALITGENKLYFAIIYNPKSQFLGPTLSELPGVLAEFEEKNGIEIADAINLDGGSTSSFYSQGFSLSEISFSGSFFCEQN